MICSGCGVDKTITVLIDEGHPKAYRVCAGCLPPGKLGMFKTEMPAQGSPPSPAKDDVGDFSRPSSKKRRSG